MAKSLSFTFAVIMILALSGCNFVHAPFIAARHTNPEQVTLPSYLHGAQFPEISTLLNQTRPATTAPPPVSEIADTIDTGPQGASGPHGATDLAPNPFIQRYSAPTQAFCIGSSCSVSYLTGIATIIINHDTRSLSFHEINLHGENGISLRGTISFSTINPLDTNVITSDLTIGGREHIDEDITHISGIGIAVHDAPIDHHIAFVGFNLRDTDRDIILDVQAQYQQDTHVRN